MIEFVYKKPAYYAGVINNSLGLRTLAKFDSGAAISIIGLERFGRELQDKLFIDFFMKYTKDKGIDKKVYTAANEQAIETYPCMIDKISLDGTDITNFRFGLVLTQKSNRFLLGDDFISCCEFAHKIGGSISINNFSQSRYEASVSNTKLANLTAILSNYKKQHNSMI
ncbi:MAG: hypothetical protein HDR25_05450 [Lachnospiraceae bacterium]|nr:hypothetical protein [Lachnospiraceae bacterium]